MYSKALMECVEDGLDISRPWTFRVWSDDMSRYELVGLKPVAGKYRHVARLSVGNSSTFGYRWEVDFYNMTVAADRAAYVTLLMLHGGAR